MKRKLVFLPDVYSKEVVDSINAYFDKGYEIEEIFDVNCGRYLLLVLNCNCDYNYKYTNNCEKSDDNYNLIEDNMYIFDNKNTTNTKNIRFN